MDFFFVFFIPNGRSWHYHISLLIIREANFWNKSKQHTHVTTRTILIVQVLQNLCYVFTQKKTPFLSLPISSLPHSSSQRAAPPPHLPSPMPPVANHGAVPQALPAPPCHELAHVLAPPPPGAEDGELKLATPASRRSQRRRTWSPVTSPPPDSVGGGEEDARSTSSDHPSPADARSSHGSGDN